MHILILGGGGREHALVRALKASTHVKRLSCAPGNPGMANEATCYLTDPQDPTKVMELAKRLKPDLVIIGPEGPLAHGVSDALRQAQFNVFGPSQSAARLETSKIWAKNFMKRHGIPTADFQICSSPQELMDARKSFPEPWVIKADGLAAGKGVRICETEAEYNRTADDFFKRKVLGSSGEKVLLEKHIDGVELSLMVLVAGDQYVLLPLCQDHKRLLDKNKGPNTGGMGAFAPVKGSNRALKSIENKIVIPTLDGLKKEGMDYRGVLYFGLMMDGNDPYLLEYNVRFGDPEAQVLMPLLDGDWSQVFSKVAAGKIPSLKWKKQYAVCVVLAAPGYPELPQKGLRITLDKVICKSNAKSYLLHGGTASHRGYITNGGRVLNSIGLGKTLAQARSKAYALVEGVSFENMHFRKDIALTKD